jgi:hypothetical protein
MTPRPDLTRPLRPYSELLDQAHIHRILRAVVTHFFTHTFGSAADPLAALEAKTLEALDPAVTRLA